MKSRKIWKTVLIALGCALGAWAFGALLLDPRGVPARNDGAFHDAAVAALLQARA